MKTRFLKLLVSFFVFLPSLKGYAGGLQCYLNMTNQVIPYHSTISFSATCFYQGGYTGKQWYLHIKSDNPAVTISLLNNLTSPGTGIINKRNDGLYQLPDLSIFGNSHNLELETNFDSTLASASTANLSVTLFYVGNRKDSVFIDQNGNPRQYYSEYTTSISRRLTFLPYAQTSFADYTLTSTAIVCDTIQYSLSEKGEGYSTLSNFIIDTDLPSGFTYIPNSSTFKIYNKANQLRTSFSVEPSILQDTALSWNLSTVTPMNMIKTDSSSYFTLSFKILPRPGYTRDSISGTVSATKSSGGTIQKNIPWLILDPSSQPSPIVQLLPDSIIFIEGDSGLLSVTNSINTSCTYTWQKDNVDLAGTSSKDLLLTNVSQADSGVYRCLVYNNCHQVSTNTTMVKINKVVTIPEEPSDPEENNSTTNISNRITGQNLNVYPNPSSGIIYLNLTVTISYILTDLTGAPLKEGFSASDGSINIQEIPSGFYFLQIRQGETIQAVKIFRN